MVFVVEKTLVKVKIIVKKCICFICGRNIVVLKRNCLCVLCKKRKCCDKISVLLVIVTKNNYYFCRKNSIVKITMKKYCFKENIYVKNKLW